MWAASCLSLAQAPTLTSFPLPAADLDVEGKLESAEFSRLKPQPASSPAIPLGTALPAGVTSEQTRHFHFAPNPSLASQIAVSLVLSRPWPFTWTPCLL